MDSLTGLSLLVAFLLGSIPFGILLSKLFGLPDPRSFGSGNIGATNVLRTGNKGVAATTLLLDGLKGFTAVFLTNIVEPDFAPFSAILVILGHIYSPWLGFKGGKGVATTFGAMFGISPPAGFIMALLWILTFYALRVSSLAALIAMIFAPIIVWLDKGMLLATVTLLITTLIFHTHRDNIIRLVNGTEPRFKPGEQEQENDTEETSSGAEEETADADDTGEADDGATATTSKDH